MKKVAVYHRVSAHSDSEAALHRQEAKVQKYCEDKGYQIVDSYSSVGDRKHGSDMLLKCLHDMKEKEIDTVVMSSTNRVVGTVDELMQVKKAYEEAGVSIETSDGSHLFPQVGDLIAQSTLVSSEGNDEAIIYGLEDENVELVFGYDVTNAGLVVNEAEAEVVKYIFAKSQEYTTNPPSVLVQEVIGEYASRGEEITSEEAAGKVPYARITCIIEDEVKEKWPEQYEMMLQKQNHNRVIFERRELKSHVSGEPIIDRETWEKAQAIMTGAQDDAGPQMGGMTMS